VPRELFAVEQQHLRPLPVWVPEVYRLHERMVDVEGYVTVNTNRYSVPVDWIGRRVEVRETSSKIEIQPEQSNIFFKLMEERYHRRSTIITTNLGYSEWGNFLGNPTMVDALLSRIRHYCHTVPIDGPSLRDPQG